MQIVIDIPDEEYNECKMQVGLMKQEGIIIESLNTALKIFVANGTPLPKGHGRLIDADVLMRLYGLEDVTKYGNETAEQQTHSYDTMMMYEIADMIDDAPTIIEADKAGEEE